MALAQLFQCLAFIFTALHYIGNTQFFGAPIYHGGLSASNNCHGNARTLQQLDTQAILDVKSLQLFAIIAVVNPAVGEDAIDVQCEQFDGLSFIASVGHSLYPDSHDASFQQVIQVNNTRDVIFGVGNHQ